MTAAHCLNSIGLLQVSSCFCSECLRSFVFWDWMKRWSPLANQLNFYIWKGVLKVKFMYLQGLAQYFTVCTICTTLTHFWLQTTPWSLLTIHSRCRVKNHILQQMDSIFGLTTMLYQIVCEWTCIGRCSRLLY